MELDELYEKLSSNDYWIEHLRAEIIDLKKHNYWEFVPDAREALRECQKEQNELLTLLNNFKLEEV